MLFGRLTERAQRVLAHAQEEAIRLNPFKYRNRTPIIGVNERT